MKLTRIIAVATVAGAAGFGGGAAEARGGGADIAEQREKFEEEFRAARANNDCQTASLWEMMFGHDEGTAVAEARPTTTSN